MKKLYSSIANVPDFPIPGIIYRDIQPILKDQKLFKESIKSMYDLVPELPDYWVGVEARGFIFASALSVMFGGGLVLVRKKGKLPNKNLISKPYGLEYGSGTLEIEGDQKGTCIIVDDIFATGGTIKAAGEIASEAGFDVLSKLCFLNINIAESPKDLISLFNDKTS